MEEEATLELSYDWTDYTEGRVTIRHGYGSVTLDVRRAKGMLQQAAREIEKTLHERWMNS